MWQGVSRILSKYIKHQNNLSIGQRNATREIKKDTVDSLYLDFLLLEPLLNSNYSSGILKIS